MVHPFSLGYNDPKRLVKDVLSLQLDHSLESHVIKESASCDPPDSIPRQTTSVVAELYPDYNDDYSHYTTATLNQDMEF